MKDRNYNIKQIAENQNVLQIYLYGEIEPGYLDCWGYYYGSTTSAEYIRKAIDASRPIEINFGDPDVLEATQIAKKVGNERLRVVQFTRFQ